MELLNILHIQSQGQERDNASIDKRSETGQEESFAAVMQKQQQANSADQSKNVGNDGGTDKKLEEQKQVAQSKETQDSSAQKENNHNQGQNNTDSQQDPQKEAQQKVENQQKQVSADNEAVKTDASKKFDALAQSELKNTQNTQAVNAQLQQATQTANQGQQVINQGQPQVKKENDAKLSMKDQLAAVKEKLDQALQEKNIDTKVHITLGYENENKRLSGFSSLTPSSFIQNNSALQAQQQGAFGQISSFSMLNNQQTLQTNSPTANTSQFSRNVMQENMMNQIRVQMTKSVEQGMKNIEIKLQPASLGKIDVKLDFQSDGMVKTTFVVEKPETLDMLQRDQRHIENILKDSGLRANMENLHFQSQQNNKEFAQGEKDTRGTNLTDANLQEDEFENQAQGPDAYQLQDILNKGIQEGRLDFYV